MRKADGDLTKMASTAEQSLLDKIKGLVPKWADVGSLVRQMKDAADQAVRSVIQLIVIFVLETVIMPLLFVWVMGATARLALRRS